MTRLHHRACRAAGLLLVLGACSEVPWEREYHLLQNTSFDDWCDAKTLCHWEHSGEPMFASWSWHAGDLSLGFPHGATTLRQRAVEPYLASSPYECIEVDVMVDGDVDLSVALDFDADGSVEWEQPLQTGTWRSNVLRVQPPYWYDEVELTLTKAAAPGVFDKFVDYGRISHVRLMGRYGVDCDAARWPQAAGTPCRTADDCASEHCADVDDLDMVWGERSPEEVHAPTEPVCSECETDADCAGAEVCGAAWGPGPLLHRACVPAGEVGLGEVCGVDEQCDSGVCCNGRCSECCSDGDCDAGRCTPRIEDAAESRELVAAMCEAGPRPAGASCLADVDCAGSCGGDPLLVCAGDGRGCATDADCADASCVAVGVRDGVCE